MQNSSKVNTTITETAAVVKSQARQQLKSLSNSLLELAKAAGEAECFGWHSAIAKRRSGGGTPLARKGQRWFRPPMLREDMPLPAEAVFLVSSGVPLLSRTGLRSTLSLTAKGRRQFLPRHKTYTIMLKYQEIFASASDKQLKLGVRTRVRTQNREYIDSISRLKLVHAHAYELYQAIGEAPSMSVGELCSQSNFSIIRWRSTSRLSIAFAYAKSAHS